MKLFIAKHAISLAFFAALCIGVVAPVVSDSSDDKPKNSQKTANQQIAGAKNHKQAMDTLYEAMNSVFYMIEPTLRNSCYDCHSDQTNYPWYHSLPFIGDMIDEDIAEAREHLDFSNGFPLKGKGSQLKLYAEIIEELEDGEMPLLSYRIMHWGTAVEGPELDTVKIWFTKFSSMMKNMYGFYGEPLPEDIY